ncbi:hypothetical protein VTO58DRAFT_109991 [Aureobasidium pullulans]
MYVVSTFIFNVAAAAGGVAPVVAPVAAPTAAPTTPAPSPSPRLTDTGGVKKPKAGKAKSKGKKAAERLAARPCFNCGQVGHKQDACVAPPFCSKCQAIGHRHSGCPGPEAKKAAAEKAAADKAAADKEAADKEAAPEVAPAPRRSSGWWF